MAGGNIIGDPVCVMWRRAALESMGYFNPEIVYCTDMEYWLRLLSIGDLYYDERPMGLYRIHKNAAAKGLSKVAAADIHRTAALQVQRGGMKLSRFELGKVWITALVMSRVRQVIYNVLG
jgi:GT2 family glycosyltransferase